MRESLAIASRLLPGLGAVAPDPLRRSWGGGFVVVFSSSLAQERISRQRLVILKDPFTTSFRFVSAACHSPDLLALPY